MLALQLRQQIEAGPAGQDEIEHDDVGPSAQHRRPALLGVERRADVPAEIDQHLPQRVQHLGLVFDDEDASEGSGHHQPRRAAGRRG